MPTKKKAVKKTTKAVAKSTPKHHPKVTKYLEERDGFYTTHPNFKWLAIIFIGAVIAFIYTFYRNEQAKLLVNQELNSLGLPPAYTD